MTTAVHIVPSLPPPLEGVGTYALRLADALRARSGINSAFLVASPVWTPDPKDPENIPEMAGRRALPLAAPTPEALRSALAALAEPGERPLALLHYAGYGYHPRGCPDWLIEALEGWNGRLVTAFHEVWASGPPWRSSFWLSPRQQRLAGRLARRSDGLVTSLDTYRRLLLRAAPGREAVVMPVFSTVGEPEPVPPLQGRSPCLVLFGGPGARSRAYRHLGTTIARACEALALEEIWDLGPPIPEPPERIAGRPVRRLGPLPAAVVSRTLLAAVAGFVSYPAPLLAKSTIFAAYCSHGMLPVSAWPWPRRRVEPPPPFWRLAAASSEDPQEVADRGRAWYSRHSLDRCAELYGRLLLA